MAKKRLYLTKGKIAGVCAGIAEYLDKDVTIVRIIGLILFVVTPGALFFYIICAIVLPKKEDLEVSDFQNSHCEETPQQESTSSETPVSPNISKVEDNKKAAYSHRKDYDSEAYNKNVTGYQK